MAAVIDIIIVMVLGISAFVGLTRGLIHELLSLLVWVLSIYLVFVFGHDIADLFKDQIASGQLRFMIGATLTFLPTFLILSVVRRSLERVFLKGGPDSHDHLFGFLFGSMRGTVIVMATLILGNAFGVKDQQWWNESWLIGVFDQAVETALPMMPKGLQEQIDAQNKPKITRRIILRLDPSGHFQSKGSINGYPVEFLLDTGASLVSIPKELAQKLNLKFEDEEFMVTASGRVTAYKTHIDEIKIGSITLKNVRGAILDQMGDYRILLGMSFLERLDFQKSGKQLILEQKILP
ncbi:MAG: TIGR02281 family clan AA aspartic protease [Methylococcales bacterium]|jgi:membrane protein required for colicin V production|nr:TIGR02281 family clan AA aspartic protease [Methylococcales bacterium]MBT7411361.1 TIGR02281 family clan AA aspartic protease [Methylococcales bacterium]